MMRMATVAAALCALAGCAHRGALNPTYFPRQGFAEEQRVDGRALVITAPADDAFVYEGRPESFTGSATTLALPLGVITREAAAIAFGDLFRGGADRTNAVAGLESYRVVIAPRATRFSYAYNALRNLGFAVTPEVTVTLTVHLVDAQGKPTWERSYDSGTFRGDTYFMTGTPGETVNQAAHRAIYDLVLRAAADVAAELRARPQAPPAAPPPAAPPPA
jgi:hypothetical protein